MKKLFLSFFILSSFAFTCLAQSKVPLPRGAVIVETRDLASAGHADRKLVLWMLSPKKNPTGYAADDPYTCPDYSRGSHFSGRARVSLVNTKTNAILNTLLITGSGGEPTIDLPYAIRRGHYYEVEGTVAEGVEGKPIIMRLSDYNGDGKPLEFALFDAVACMGLQTALIGYSEKQDRVIFYPIVLTEVAGKKQSNSRSFWADYLFNKEPVRPGYWKYEVDYRGRAGTLDYWEVTYNKAKEQFEGTVKFVPDDSSQ
jgi:hypothetical protein